MEKRNTSSSGKPISMAYLSDEPATPLTDPLKASNSVNAPLKGEIHEVDPRKNLDIGAPVKIDVQHLNFYYGSKQALYDVSLPIRERQVTALIGPSGCGKSTFLRTLNRMNDLILGTRTEGVAQFGEENIYAKGIDVVLLRQRIGMVFQRPNPFPKSIFDNVAYGLRVLGKSGNEVRKLVEQSLRGAGVWAGV